MEIQTATQEDVESYSAFGRVAQAWLRARGLDQYVPSAHEEYASAIRARVESGTLFVVRSEGEPIGFFSLDPQPSAWWPKDGTRALYLAGMVVAPTARGCGIGGAILRWCVKEAVRRSCRFVRLDCHAGNPWLCRYYESHGFVLQRRVEQHPGYEGCLYQLDVTSHDPDPAV